MPKDIRKVKPPKLVDHGPELPIKGQELIDQQYGNIFCAAVTKSGKTVTISHVVRNTIDRRTRVCIFAHTAHLDKTYIHLINWLKKHKIDHTVYTSLVDSKTKQNHLQNELDAIEERMRNQKDKNADEDEEEINKSTNVVGTVVPTSIYKVWTTEEIKKALAAASAQQNTVQRNIDQDEEVKTARKSTEKKPKDRVPENVFILDDLSKQQLRSPAIINLLKEARHFKLRVFISSQGILHIQPDSMQNLYEIWIFKGFSRKQIYQLADRISTSLSPDQLYHVYKQITSKKYQFMNMNLVNDTIRPSFGDFVSMEKLRRLRPPKSNSPVDSEKSVDLE